MTTPDPQRFGGNSNPQTASPKSSGGGNAFTKKLGPLPLWAWMGVGLAIALVIALWQQSRKSAAAQQTITPDQTTAAGQIPQFVNISQNTEPPVNVTSTSTSSGTSINPPPPHPPAPPPGHPDNRIQITPQLAGWLHELPPAQRKKLGTRSESTIPHITPGFRQELNQLTPAQLHYLANNSISKDLIVGSHH